MKFEKFIFVLLLGCISFVGNAQIVDSEISKLFKKPKNIKWLRHYQGTVDDMKKVNIALAFDGNHCKGVMEYVSSKEKVQLNGVIKKGKLKLEEVNGKEVTGYIEGKYDADVIDAEWSNHDHSVGGQISAVEIDYLKKQEIVKENWVWVYKGFVNNKPAEVILYKIATDQIHGQIYFNDAKKSYDLNGTFKTDRIFNADLVDLNLKKNGVLTAELSHNNVIKGFFEDSNGKKSKSSLELYRKLKLESIEYGDFKSSYDIYYPISGNQNFNNWFNRFVEGFLSSCRQQTSNIRKEEKEASNRLKYRSNAWTDISYFSDFIISGGVTFNKAWSDEQQIKTFNYDLYSDKEISLQSLFIDGFDFKKLIEKEIRASLKNNALVRDPDFRKWVKQEDFSNFTIRKDGINFSTHFNAIYGKQSVTIPFGKLKTYINKDSAVYRLTTN